jgi:hypothetical protein
MMIVGGAHNMRAQDVAAFSSTTGTLVLLGERPRSQRAGQQPVVVAIDRVASDTLPAMKIVDMTVEDAEPARATLERARKALQAGPDAVIIFTGRADSISGIKDESFRATLTELARVFTRADVEVFIVPSATFVGADVIANLRLAADDAAVQYVEPGTEISGEPYASVIADVAKLVTARRKPTDVAPKPAVVVAAPTPSVTEKPTSSVVVAGPAATPATIYMVPPPALKNFDPRETPTARKRMGKLKKPAFEE